jgi:hypothetical protein
MWNRTKSLAVALPAAAVIVLASSAAVRPSHGISSTHSGYVDARAALQKLDGLVGTWSAVDRARGDKPYTNTIKRTGGGKTIVHEQGGMLTVYHPDGANLMMTHYCGAANQPRMRLDKFDGKTMSFSMFDITNLSSPKAYHTNRTEIVFVNDDKVLVTYHGIADGKVESQTFELTRQR